MPPGLGDSPAGGKVPREALPNSRYSCFYLLLVTGALQDRVPFSFFALSLLRALIQPRQARAMQTVRHGGCKIKLCWKLNLKSWEYPSGRPRLGSRGSTGISMAEGRLASL